jgi:NNP family nitrate/nitrite transporter-like MFS transporter
MTIATTAGHVRMPAQARRRKAISVLIASTLAFTVCFMVWMMFGVIGIPIKQTLGLNATQFGLLTATPVLTGSLIRVPLGIWTDRYGGRIVMAS